MSSCGNLFLKRRSAAESSEKGWLTRSIEGRFSVFELMVGILFRPGSSAPTCLARTGGGSLSYPFFDPFSWDDVLRTKDSCTP